MPPPCTKTGRGYAHTKQFTEGKLGEASGVHILLLTNLPLFLHPFFYLKEMVEVAQHTLEMPPTQGGNHFADGPKLNGGNPPEMTPNP